MNEPDDGDGTDRPITPDPERIGDLVTSLETASEQLGDLSIDLLRRAVEEGGGTRPPADKALASARRAIDKAIRTLESLT